ncbi:uncharacterized protein LOC112569644 [Pomacea canaliculata]|uniref:uncharacterized protein LOC112569644 n=1 Tax=Pomacea canaliculata TaxID=400727 RepID=UPI000D72FC32|nr:uncharacterized protein LOC112569644 [Pomacea canaliculata]XP_025103289.1 uncharacterized protein LOC112569644 [Pomacea canaliculata]
MDTFAWICAIIFTSCLPVQVDCVKVSDDDTSLQLYEILTLFGEASVLYISLVTSLFSVTTTYIQEWRRKIKGPNLFLFQTFAKETVFMQNTLLGITCYSLCLYVGVMLSFLVLLASTGLSYMIYGFLFSKKWRHFVQLDSPKREFSNFEMETAFLEYIMFARTIAILAAFVFTSLFSVVSHVRLVTSLVIALVPCIFISWKQLKIVEHHREQHNPGNGIHEGEQTMMKFALFCMSMVNIATCVFLVVFLLQHPVVSPAVTKILCLVILLPCVFILWDQWERIELQLLNYPRSYYLQRENALLHHPSLGMTAAFYAACVYQMLYPMLSPVVSPVVFLLKYMVNLRKH